MEENKNTSYVKVKPYYDIDGENIISTILANKSPSYSRANQRYRTKTKSGALEHLQYHLTHKFKGKLYDIPDEMKDDQHWVNINFNKTNEYLNEDFEKDNSKERKGMKKNKSNICLFKSNSTKPKDLGSISNEEYHSSKKKRIDKLRDQLRNRNNYNVRYYDPNYNSIFKKSPFPLIGKPLSKRQKKITVNSYYMKKEDEYNCNSLEEKKKPDININSNSNINSVFNKNSATKSIDNNERNGSKKFKKVFLMKPIKKILHSQSNTNMMKININIKLPDRQISRQNCINLSSEKNQNKSLIAKGIKTVNFNQMIGRNAQENYTYKHALERSISYNPNYSSTSSHIKTVIFSKKKTFEEMKRSKVLKALHSYSINCDYSIFSLNKLRKKIYRPQNEI